MCSEARRVLLLYQLYSRANIDIRIRRRVIQAQVTAAFRAIIPVPTDDGGAQGAPPLVDSREIYYCWSKFSCTNTVSPVDFTIFYFVATKCTPELHSRLGA